MPQKNRSSSIPYQTKTAAHSLIIQLIEYMVSGGVYFWSGYIMFAFLWSGLGWSLWWAKLAANVFGWTVNFTLQRYWVFNNPGLKMHQTEITGRYIFITLIDFLMDYVIVAGLTTVGISPYIGQFISASFFTLWNYLWYRFWVFPQKFANANSQIVPAHFIAHRPLGHTAYHVVTPYYIKTMHGK